MATQCLDFSELHSTPAVFARCQSALVRMRIILFCNVQLGRRSECRHFVTQNELMERESVTSRNPLCGECEFGQGLSLLCSPIPPQHYTALQSWASISPGSEQSCQMVELHQIHLLVRTLSSELLSGWDSPPSFCPSGPHICREDTACQDIGTGQVLY